MKGEKCLNPVQDFISFKLLRSGQQPGDSMYQRVIRHCFTFFSNYSCFSTLSATVRVGQWENATHTYIPTTSGMARAVMHQMGLGQGGLKFIQHF